MLIFDFQIYPFTEFFSMEIRNFTAMNKNNYNVIGVMSGTSLDGIDLVHVHLFRRGCSWSYDIISAQTVAYPESWKARLEKAVSLDSEDLEELDRDYTDFLAGRILDFIAQNELTALDVICSHGHTVKHEPNSGITLQIGNLPVLADLVQTKVVCDFRAQDVRLGGQGAPLVPIGDQLLFGDFDCCLNLGGFANISLNERGVRKAYDICAVNTVLNYLSEKLGYPYDQDGKLSASGEIEPELLERLDALEYYSKAPPKSLGIEWVRENIFPLLKDYPDIRALLRTYVVHVGRSIGKELPRTSNERVLVTGGGAFNRFLIKRIRKETKAEIVIPSVEVVNYKEALVFAFLGVLRLRGEINVLSSVTGASKNHVSGFIYEPVSS